MGIKLPPLEHPVTVQGSRVAEEPWWLWFSDIYDQINGITIEDLTANRIVATNADKELVSVADLTSWIAGTTNQITVSDDGDGTATLSLPQNIHTGASPTFTGLTLSGLTEGQVVFPGSGGVLSGDEDLFWDNSAKNLDVYGSAVFNPDGVDFDFIVKGNTGANLPYLMWADASTSRLGIGVGSAPGAKLHIEGVTDAKMLLKNTGNASVIWDFGSNRSNTGGDIFTMRGFWGGVEVAGISVVAGDDQVNKDEADWVWRLASGGVISNRFVLHQEGHAEFTGDVGIGTDSPDAKLHILSDDTIFGNITDGVQLVAEQSGAGDAGIQWQLTGGQAYSVFIDNSDNDDLKFFDMDTPTTFMQYKRTTNDVIFNGTGSVGVGTSSPGALLDVRGSAIFNENGADVDFRIEGDTEQNLFFVDASTDRIGVGTASPSTLLHLRGTAPELRIEMDNTETSGKISFFEDVEGEHARITSNGSTLFIDTADVGASIDFRSDNFVTSFTLSGAAGSVKADLRGSLFISERTAALADAVGQGQLWVKDDTPNNLYFTDDAGNDRQLVYAGGAFHDGFSDFVANEHIDHTSVTITAGTGLNGGGDISASRTLSVDGVLEDLDTLGAAASDGQFIVATGAGTFAYESGATLRTSIGVGTGDTLTLTGLNLSGLTASQAVFTDGGKNLTSNAITGTVNVVMSDSPTLTGTITAAAANFSGNVDVSGSLTLGKAAQDYVFSDRGAGLTLQSQGSATSFTMEYFAKDGDGTDDVTTSLYALGTPGDVTNRERLHFKYRASSTQYEIYTDAAGTGTVRPIKLYTGANTDQLALATDGNVGIGTASPGAKLDVNGDSIFQGLSTWNLGTTPANAILLDMAEPGTTDTTRDSHDITIRSTANSGGTGITFDWRIINKADLGEGPSPNGEFNLQYREDGAAYVTKVSVNKDGLLLTNDIQAGGAKVTDLTGSQVVFPSGDGTLIGNSNFYWNNITERLSLGAGTSPDAPIHVADGVGTVPTVSSGTVGIFQNNSGGSDVARIHVLAGTTGVSVLDLGDSSDQDVGQIAYFHADNYMRFRVNGAPKMYLDSIGLGLGGQVDSGFDLQMKGTGLFGLPKNTLAASATDAQGQAPMTASINRITSVPDSSSSVTAPDAKFGAVFGVVNEGAFAVTMYPASGQEFREQDIGVPTSKTIQAGQYFLYICMEDGFWHEIVGP